KGSRISGFLAGRSSVPPPARRQASGRLPPSRRRHGDARRVGTIMRPRSCQDNRNLFHCERMSHPPAPARRILTALQRHGPLSRADLVRQTGISGPTVTRAVAGLLARGLLEEGDALPAALGRPGRELRLARTSVAVL